ncbi:MAG: hypothetical protein KME40_33170 [Komarekiella atlantica HA4396-MV6]|jgi:hypothetical protein|nr:hypothetical protein [Komarekiella atlantica HA4396-MV6]
MSYTTIQFERNKNYEASMKNAIAVKRAAGIAFCSTLSIFYEHDIHP